MKEHAQTKKEPEEVAERLRPLLRVEYDELVKLGYFEDEKLELLYGMLVQKSPQKPLHAEIYDRLLDRLITLLAGRARVRGQLPLALSDDSEPEPDLAVVAVANYEKEHPKVAYFLIEVADSSYRQDRYVKGPLYAAAGISEYWLVDIKHQVIEVFTEPLDGEYQRMIPFKDGDLVHPQNFPDVTLRVADLFAAG